MMAQGLRCARFAMRVLGAALLATLAWVIAWVTLVPVVRGWTPVVMTSGSMGPSIETGDVVLVAPAGQDVPRGSVIVYPDPAGSGRLTHRVVARDPSGNYVTRGDANRRIDPRAVPPDEVIGVGRVLVPEIGRPYLWLGRREWDKVLGLAAGVAVAAMAARPLRIASTPAVARRPSRRATPPRPAWGIAGGALAVSLVVTTTFIVTGSRGAFGDGEATSGSSWAADTLDPPTGLAAAPSGGDVELSWTVTPDAYADGYRILRGTSPGCCYSLHDTVPGRLVSSYTDIGAGAGGVPSLEAVSTAIQGPSSGTGVTVGRPTGTSDGELLIAVVGIDNSGDSLPIVAPAGWTEIFQHGQSGGGQSALGAWYRIAASEPATYDFSWSGAEEGFAAVQRFSGVDAATPIDAWAIAGVVNDASPTAPSIVTTVDDTLVIRLVGLDNNDHVEPSPLTDIHPSGTTGMFELITDPVPGSSGGTIGAGSSSTQASAGPTGQAVFGVTGNEGWVTATIAIRPAGGSTYYYVTEAFGASWTSVTSNEASCC